MSFNQLEISEPLLRAIEAQGYVKPTEIQENAIPFLLNHEGDYVGQAQTGTGKTAAFLIPLIERLNLDSRNIEALILTPTRELAKQVHTELEKFGKFLDLRSTVIYGGVPYNKQINSLRDDRPHVVVGTPGRIIDLLQNKKLNIRDCSKLVIDEADEMLNMGFLEDVETIINYLSSNRKLWMFSATMPRPIQTMIESKFSDPEIMKTKKKTLTNENINQHYCILEKKNFLKGFKLVSAGKRNMYGIIFCETRMETKKYTEMLQNDGVKAMALNGDLNQTQRDRAMEMFKEKRINFLVCTDVASRGIDVSHITHVFNMGLPRERDSYIHRIGRTGRAGEVGDAISFITPSEYYKIKNLEKFGGQKVSELKLPTPKTIKREILENELGRMDKTIVAIKELGEEFKMDPSSEMFLEYFKDLDKEDILKTLFAYTFKKQFRKIDETLNLKSLPPGRGGRGNGDRGRGGKRRSGGGRGRGKPPAGRRRRRF